MSAEEKPTVLQAKSRQNEARQQLADHVAGDKEKARDVLYPCGPFCETLLQRHEQATPSPETQQRLQSIASRLLGKNK
jgi:hypothetical protein